MLDKNANGKIDPGELDINNNGTIDPEEDALGDIIAEQSASLGEEKRTKITWLYAVLAILVIILLIILLVIAM